MLLTRLIGIWLWSRCYTNPFLVSIYLFSQFDIFYEPLNLSRMGIGEPGRFTGRRRAVGVDERIRGLIEAETMPVGFQLALFDTCTSTQYWCIVPLKFVDFTDWGS